MGGGRGRWNHHHHGGHWHHWYALDGTPGNSTIQHDLDGLSNVAYWNGLFEDSDYMRGLTLWVTTLDNESQLSWSASLLEATGADVNVVSGHLGPDGRNITKDYEHARSTDEKNSSS